MFVERHGRGPRSYFALHGWGGDRRAFAPLAPHVPERASLYTADLPGCGLSPAPREWSVAAVVGEIVEAALSLSPGGSAKDEREEGRGLTLVGACGGAVFALLAAAESRGRVERVVMIDPFAYLPRYFRLFLAGDFGRRAYEATFANPFGRWLTNQSLRGRRAGAADLTASFAAADHDSARRHLALYDEVGGVERFRGFDIPVEIVHGEKTFGAVKRSLALWLDVLPRARVHRLEGAGHQPVFEAPERTARIIFSPAAGTAESREVQTKRGVETKHEVGTRREVGTGRGVGTARVVGERRRAEG